MAFVGEDDVIDVNERFIVDLMQRFKGIEIKRPFRRIPWSEAMARFGTDKPDLRFGMELIDVSDMVIECDFRAFRTAVEEGGALVAIAVPGGRDLSRRELDSLSDYVKRVTKAKGLAWIGLDEKGESHGSIARFFDAEFVKEMLRRANEDDTAKLLLIADADVRIAQEAAGALRLEVARRRNMIPEGMFEFCWVTAFPLFEWSEDNQRLVAKHHPFTALSKKMFPFLTRIL